MHALSHVPLKHLDLRLTVSAYTVTEETRKRLVTLLNLLQSANWG